MVWTYGGLPASQMERQITQFSEYSLTGNVSDIKAVQSDSYDGVSVIRLYLHPGADVASAMAQVTAVSQTIIRRMPPNTIPPIVVRYTASSVPILQLAFSSETLSEAKVFDFVNQRVRTMLSVVQGSRFPLPMGGRARQISVDLDLPALRAQGISSNDVSVAISAQNLTLPTGNAKVGEREYRITLNSSPEAISALNEIPLRKADGKVIYIRDVAYVHDGYAIQTNIARHNGKRAVVLSVMKTAGASTVEVADRIKALIPTIRASAPPGLNVDLLSDQSTFVTRAIHGLLVEGTIAGLLTAAMILLFVASWRSTLIVAVSIPLSVAAALLCMRALGATTNVSTLGGLALAVGILVDDATVEIENIHRNLSQGKRLTRAILDGAEQIAIPAFVASSCIAIVFVSVVFLEGPARFIFLPMGMAVGFSVMASYLLSRTIVPTMAKHLLEKEVHTHGQAPTGFFGRFQQGFERKFETLAHAYGRILDAGLAHPRRVLGAFATFVLVAIALSPFVGRDFFPRVDGGEVRMHISAPAGTRLEETERWFGRVEARIRELIPEEERESILDQMGQPSGYSLAITDSANVSSADGEVLISLSEHRKNSTEHYVSKLRDELKKDFPELSFYFQPADVVTQILNFGLPSPIDVQLSGQNRDATYDAAKKLAAELKLVPGAADVHIHQVVDAPRLHMDIDRVRSAAVGLTERDVAASLLVVISGSGQVNPTFWVDGVTSNAYPVTVGIPDYRIDSTDALKDLTVASPKNGIQTFGDLGSMSRKNTAVNISHTNVQPTYSVRADVRSSDLGRVADAARALVAKYQKQLPPGSTVSMRGQAESMREGFGSLGLGLVLAAVLVYGLIVINFQSWRDPFIILTALPGAGAGIVMALFATHTTFSIPSMMGSITSTGIATANAILVVTFARQEREHGLSALQAASSAGRVRLRPVVMTACAMLLGMLPMSLGLGEGGEQNAALGRAVIGGLVGATLATLLVVPVIYSLLAKKDSVRVVDPDLVFTDVPMNATSTPEYTP